MGFIYFDARYDNLEAFEKIQFPNISPYVLDGELAEIATRGSLHNKWDVNATITKLMTTEFVNTIMEGRFDDFIIYRTQDNWLDSQWEDFVACFLFDRRKGEIGVLAKHDIY